MRWLVSLVAIPLVAIPLHLQAQYQLFACITSTKEYVVGAKLAPSGLFVKSANDEWLHAGYNHPFLFALDYDPADPSTVYLAAGNGLIRASKQGQTWKFLTGSDVTEIRDVAVDKNAPGTVYFGYSNGIRVSHDKGDTWQEIGGGLHRKFTEALRVDRQKAGILLAGGEEGVFRSENGGQTWRIAGAAGWQILRIEQSPHNACRWLATTQGGGLFGSTDCGVTFENMGRVGVGHNLYDVAFDPLTPRRIALAGWSMGVAISEDDGATWQFRNSGLPRMDVVAVIFDPVNAGRMYASVQEAGFYRSDDGGKSWVKNGLENSVVARMKFIPEVASR